LAELGGQDLTRGFLSAVETGRSSISLKALALLADRLQLPVSYFLDGLNEAHDLLPELLLDEAEAALQTQRPTDAVQLVERAGQVPEFRSRVLWLQGAAFNQLGRAREAIPLLEDALALSENEGDLRRTVITQYTLAMAMFLTTNYDGSLAHLRRAHDRIFGEIDDQSLLGKITVAIGHVQFLQGNVDGASEQYARARQLFATLDDLDNLAAVYTGLSRTHRQNGHLKESLRYSRLSIAIFEARNNQREAAHELANMAARYEELGETDKALGLAQDAVLRAQRTHALDIESLARSTLATVFLRLGQLDEAQAQAVAVQELGLNEEDLGVIDTLIVLAKMAEHAGDRARADERFLKSLTTLESNGLHMRYADVALAYSEALRTRGDVQGALDWALTAAKVLKGRSA
jgi:tetratricopeptide (TPR) repeat protein